MYNKEPNVYICIYMYTMEFTLKYLILLLNFGKRYIRIRSPLPTLPSSLYPEQIIN